MCSCFGGAVGGRLSYREFYGLWLNVPRVRLAQAVAVCRGVGLALSADNVPLAYCEAVSLGEDDGDALMFDTNAARNMARVMARHRRG